MPTAAMTNDSAQSHIQSNWAYAGGATDYLSFVDDPFEDNGTALAVKFRRGSEGGGGPGTAGGVGAMMLKVFGETVQERAIMSYQVLKNRVYLFKAKSGHTGGVQRAF